jgi:hypothetical protein
MGRRPKVEGRKPECEAIAQVRALRPRLRSVAARLRLELRRGKTAQRAIPTNQTKSDQIKVNQTKKRGRIALNPNSEVGVMIIAKPVNFSGFGVWRGDLFCTVRLAGAARTE